MLKRCVGELLLGSPRQLFMKTKTCIDEKKTGSGSYFGWENTANMGRSCKATVCDALACDIIAYYLGRKLGEDELKIDMDDQMIKNGWKELEKNIFMRFKRKIRGSELGRFKEVVP